MPVHETDICIIGGGITSAMLAAEALRASSRRPHHRRRSRPIDLRRAEPRPLSRPRDGVRRASLARRLHRGSAGRRHHLDDHGGRRAGAALGRRVQSVFRGRPAAEVDVRPRGGLADRVARARALLLRSRAAAERQRRAESASRRPPVGAVSAGTDPAVLQPADAQGLGGAERPQVLGAADGAQPDAVRRPRRLLRVRHLRRGVPVGRALLAGLHVPPADGAEEDRAARSHARPPADARRARPTIVAAQGVHQDRPGDPSSTARRRSSSRPATAGARTCCCCRRTRAFRTASRTARGSSAGT